MKHVHLSPDCEGLDLVEKGEIYWIGSLLVRPKPIVFGVSLTLDKLNIMCSYFD